MAEKQAKKQTKKPVKGTALGAGVSPKLGDITVGPMPPPVIITPGPIPHLIEYVGNLFSNSRAGHPVVRPDDLLALRIELVNVARMPGSKPPVLVAGANGAASLIVHHPPQSIAEEVYFEGAAAGTGEPSKPPPPDDPPEASNKVPDNDVDPPPIRARAANESRVVFEWPAGFECPYTLDGLLGAIRTLKMRVPPGALPRQQQRRVLALWPRWQSATKAIVTTKGKAGATAVTALQVQAMPGLSGTALNAFSLRQTQIARRGGEGAQATLRRRLGDVIIGSGAALPDFVLETPPVMRLLPKPALPTATQTAIELPWRLIISPHDGEHWRHATAAATSPYSGHTELWHTRLLGPAGVDSLAADPGRTFRAVWATTGWSGKAMQQAFPSGAKELPGTDQGNPFVTSETALSDYDRYQITHLSSNFSMANYEPQPIDTRLLMLSSQGAWLDSRGDWDPPGLDVESWVHHATQGRDHYVRVVYRGVLFPFGHRAVLIKVSERKFHKMPGNPAYLRQRMFMVVREKVKHYDDASQLRPFGASNATVEHELPFTSVRMLTTVTPDLAKPSDTQIDGQGQQLFWPAVGPSPNPTPFKFRMAGTDLDGREVQFELPLIFMSNVMASPRDRVNNRLVPKHGGADGAAAAANKALTGWRQFQMADILDDPQGDERATAQLKRQRVTLALSNKPGDTSAEVAHLTFDAHVPSTSTASTSFKAFKAFTPDLLKPMFYPRVSRLKVRIGAMAQLTGAKDADGFNRLRWNTTYLQSGFDPNANKGEVFAEVVTTAGMGRLDFSKQGDHSGGFVMPNLSPSALSRSLGPTAGNVGDMVAGKVMPDNFFPAGGVGDLPLPLLFGCIPLGAVIKQIDQLAGNLDKAPKFASEAGSKVEAFFNDLMRLYQFISGLASQPGTLGSAALQVVIGTVTDLADQAKAFGAAELASINAQVTPLMATLNSVQAQLKNLGDKTLDAANPLAGIDLTAALDAPQGSGQLRTRLQALKDAVQASSVIPAGFRQQVNAVVSQALTILDSIKLIAGLVGHGKTLFDALKNLLDNPAPGQSLGELITKPAELEPKVAAIKNALSAVKGDVAAFPLLEGPPRKTLLSILGVVEDALTAVGPLLEMLENLLGEELVVRFDWKPEIKNWSFKPGGEPLFVVHDPHAFIVAVEARMKKSGGAPRIQVLCGLHHFDLVLIAPASFIELNFEKIEFSIDSSAKMNVDVLLSDIKFVGPLSFVETLRDLIPLDGFSDPPYLDITPQGIDAGFNVALPAITCGVLNLSNVSLGAGFTVPFIGQPLSVRFNFCTREQPFHLTVYVFGGGGFFGITLDPHGVQILEAAFEFGAAISIDFGVASGGVSVMAGIYFRMENDAASLTGYFRLEGHVDVLGLITASLELYLELRYEFETGKAVGKATLTIEIEVFIFSGSVTISCEKKFAGSNGDPTLRQLLGTSADPTLPLATELAGINDSTRYGWRDYCEAFA